MFSDNVNDIRLKISTSKQGTNVDVINLLTNERLAAWSADQVVEEVETEITCVATLSSDPGNKSRVSHVILGLDTALRGDLAVLDIAESRIVR